MLPFGRTRQTYDVSVVLCWYAIQFPAGDQRGNATCSAGGIAIRLGRDPSARMRTSARGITSRSEATISRPSGDQLGHHNDVSIVRTLRPRAVLISKPVATRW